MRLVERHIIKESHQHGKEIDKFCFLSKNIYNYANYLVRQSLIFNKNYLNYNQIYHQFKNSPYYGLLPSTCPAVSRPAWAPLAPHQLHAFS